jgi:hypothetical protein
MQTANIVFAIDKPILVIKGRSDEFGKLLLVKILPAEIGRADLKRFDVLADVQFDAFWQADGRISVRAGRRRNGIEIEVRNDQIVIVNVIDGERGRAVLDHPDRVTLMRKDLF